MDDLRWVLLLVGAVVVAAIYFSSRFESEDWSRERKQFAKNKKGRSGKKARRKRTASKTAPSKTAPLEASPAIKKEPTMESVEPVVETPAVSELVIEMPSQTEVMIEEAEVKSVPAEVDSPAQEKEIAPVEVNTVEPTKEASEVLPVAASIEPGIEDEITEVEIPVDLAVAEAEIHSTDAAAEAESKQAEESSSIEPLVLSVIVLADEDETFSGPEVKEALEAEGLNHGAMSIFHYHDTYNKKLTDNDDAVFGVANILEPGFFDLHNMDEMQTPGLLLFCQLPGPLSGDAALEIMLDKGRGLAVRLHGHMCDEKRNRFTTQAKNHYLDRISAFDRELVLSRSKTPAN